MIHTEKDMKQWKNEQVRYYQNYLANFDKNSKEYRMINKGIADLKNTGL